MTLELWVLTAMAALNVLAVLLWCQGRFRVVIGAAQSTPRPRPDAKDETAAAAGRGEALLAEDLERFRRRLQEKAAC